MPNKDRANGGKESSGRRLSGLGRLAVWLTLAALAPLIGSVPASAPEDPLLDLGSFLDRSPDLAETVRLVSYNLHGPPTDKIEPLTEALRSEPALRDAAVFSLQEVNRNHAGSGNRDMARELARALKCHYAYAVELEHKNGGGERGLAIVSRYEMSDVERFVLPVEGPGGRRRISLGATIHLGPEKLLRVYDLHLETRISVKERGEQIQAILDHAQRYADLPTVILGDFNTFTNGATRRMNELMEAAGFQCPLAGDEKTFQQKFFLRLKLDWIWARNLKMEGADVEGDIVISDHRPLWVDLDAASLSSVGSNEYSNRDDQ